MAGKKHDRANTRNMQQLIERRMLCGVRSSTELAEAFGVSERDMKHHMTMVKRAWRENPPLNGKEYEEIRGMRIRQLEQIMTMAHEEYVRSCNVKEEVTIVRRLCPDCNGTQVDEIRPGEVVPCATCLGEGDVVQETRKFTGQTGNAAYLRVMRDCVESMGRFDGSITPATNTRIGLIKSSKQVGGEIEERTYAVFDQAEPDQVLRLLTVADEIKRNIEDKGDVIDAEFVSKGSKG